MLLMMMVMIMILTLLFLMMKIMVKQLKKRIYGLEGKLVKAEEVHVYQVENVNCQSRWICLRFQKKSIFWTS